MNYWVVKCRDRLSGGGEGWHWDHYFKRPFRGRFDFGGPDWIKSNWSKSYIRRDVSKGDFVLCYQYERQEIHGITRMVSDGLDEPRGSGDFNLFYLVPRSRALEFADPVSVKELRKEDCHPECFGPGKQGTIFPLSRAEFQSVLTTIAKIRPAEFPRIVHWLGGGKPADYAKLKAKVLASAIKARKGR